MFSSISFTQHLLWQLDTNKTIVYQTFVEGSLTNDGAVELMSIEEGGSVSSIKKYNAFNGKILNQLEITVSFVSFFHCVNSKTIVATTSSQTIFINTETLNQQQYNQNFFSVNCIDNQTIYLSSEYIAKLNESSEVWNIYYSQTKSCPSDTNTYTFPIKDLKNEKNYLWKICVPYFDSGLSEWFLFPIENGIIGNMINTGSISNFFGYDENLVFVVPVGFPYEIQALAVEDSKPFSIGM